MPGPGERLERLLRRRTTSGEVLAQLDGLRFLAIGTVLLFHVEAIVAGRAALATGPAPLAGDPTHELLSVGYVGVRLFFVISGFILALPFARAHLLGSPRPPLRAYFLRRVTRLEPPYVVNMIVAALVLLAFGHAAGVVLPHLAASLGYVHQLAYGGPSLVNHVAWSLEIEVQFYVLAPLLSLVFTLRPAWLRRGVLLLALVTAALAQRAARLELEHGSFLHHELHYFLAGFLLADLHLGGWSEVSAWSRAWDAAGVAAWAFLASLLVDASVRAPGAFHALHQDHPHLAMCALLFVACAAAFRGGATRRLLSWAPISLVGGTCYTLYLWHPLVMGALARAGGVPEAGSHAARVAAAALLLVPATIVAGCLLFVALEKPFMDPRWPQRAWAAIRGRGASPRGSR